MGDVKWIKITTDIFDDEKILLIESMPDADAIIVIWFKLLCLAGKQNNHGVFMMNNRIAYTDKMLATIFRRKESTVQMALKIFQEYGMIEVVDGTITIPNWGKHQNLDKLESKSAYMKEYMRGYREKQKMQIEGGVNGKANCKTNGKANVSEAEEDIDKEEEIEVEIEEDKERYIEEAVEKVPEREKINYQQIADMYNETCVSFPRLRSLSDSRKRAIKARLNTYTVDDFAELFKKAEASAFLKGKNSNNWSATFDWLIADTNMAKVLDGNYDNKGGSGNGRGSGKVDGGSAEERWHLRADVS